MCDISYDLNNVEYIILYSVCCALAPSLTLELLPTALLYGHNTALLYGHNTALHCTVSH
jgi:hypothetical protein